MDSRIGTVESNIRILNAALDSNHGYIFYLEVAGTIKLSIDRTELEHLVFDMQTALYKTRASVTK